MRKRLVERFNKESVSDSLYGHLQYQTKNQIEDYIDSGKFSYMGIKWTFLKRKPDIVLKKDRPVRQSMFEHNMSDASPESIHEEVENFFSPQPLRCVLPNISSLGLKKQSRRYEHETTSKGSESPQNRNYRMTSINEFNKSSHEVKGHLSNILTTDGTTETRNKTPTMSRRSASRNTLHGLAATGDKTPTVKGYLSIFSEDKKSMSIRDKRCATPDQKRSMTPLALRRGRHKSNANPFNSLRASATIDPSEVIHSISSDQNREGLNMIGASQTLDLSPTASIDRSNFVPILVYEPERKSQTKKNLDIKNASLVSTMLRDSTNISLSEKLDVLNQSYDPLNKPDMSDGINPKNGRRFIGRFSAIESDFPLEMFEKWREEDEANKNQQRQGSFKEIQQQPKFLQRPYTKALSKVLEKVAIDVEGNDSVQNQRNTTVEYGHSILREKYKSYLEEVRSKKAALEAKLQAKDQRNTGRSGRSGRNLLKNPKEQQKAKLNFSLDKEKVELNLENIIEKTKMGSYDVPTLTKVLDNMRSRRPHELGSKFLKMTFRPKQTKERGSKAKSLSLVSKSYIK